MHPYYLPPGFSLNAHQLYRLRQAILELEQGIDKLPTRPEGLRVFEAYVTTDAPLGLHAENAYVIQRRDDEPKPRKWWRRRRD